MSSQYPELQILDRTDLGVYRGIYGKFIYNTKRSNEFT